LATGVTLASLAGSSTTPTTRGQYANNRIEADHGQLKRRLRPMREHQDRSPRHRRDRRACVRAEPARGHHELARDEPVALRLKVALDELAVAI
jgi:hypothetical protein